MTESSTDRIEKKILLRAPRPKVWRALTDVASFGKWLSIALEGTFSPGARVSGPVTYKGHEGLLCALTVERMEPERLFSYRWHPGAVEPGVDYSSEPTTLVVFELEETPQGTLLTVTESGFERIPLARRAEAFRMNSQGWDEVLETMARSLGDAA